MFRWEIEVLEYDTYGNKITKRTPVSVLAETKSEVTSKVRAAFEAKYDDFRKFWSHGWSLGSLHELPADAEIRTGSPSGGPEPLEGT